jgi:hypothetical protein
VDGGILRSLLWQESPWISIFTYHLAIQGLSPFLNIARWPTTTTATLLLGGQAPYRVDIWTTDGEYTDRETRDS